MVVEVTDWQRAVIRSVQHKQFAVARLVLHVYFVTKQSRARGAARGRKVTVPLQRAAQPEQLTPAGVADVQHLAGGVAELIHAKLPRQVAR